MQEQNFKTMEPLRDYIWSNGRYIFKDSVATTCIEAKITKSDEKRKRGHTETTSPNRPVSQGLKGKKIKINQVPSKRIQLLAGNK